MTGWITRPKMPVGTSEKDELKRMKLIGDWHLGSSSPREKAMGKRIVAAYFKHLVGKTTH